MTLRKLSGRWLMFAFFMGAFPAVSIGQIYHCKDARGNMSFQSAPCEDVTVKVDETSASTASVPRSKPKVEAGQQGCDEQVKKVLDLILKDINGHYNRRVKRCKKDYAHGTSHRRNCLQEQEDIKKEKMKREYLPRAKACE